MPAVLSSASPAVFAIMGLGPMELAIFCVVVLLLFGHRLPSVMRSLGSGIVEFKKGVKGAEEGTEEAAKLKDDAKSSKP
jgi:sec-independent protein translocase protein TatA